MIGIEEYPWINNIYQDIDISNLPHASIIEGSKGLGKFLLAKKIANDILSNSSNKSSETLILNNSHPDLFINSDNTKILINEIRQLIDFSNLSSAVSNAKVIILQNCENMNLESQNAILKTLEEPPENTFIIMTSSKRKSLNQTIYSRCNKILIKDLDQNQVTDWVKSQGIEDFNFYDYPSYLAPMDILENIENGRANDYLDLTNILLDFSLNKLSSNNTLKKIIDIDLPPVDKINLIIDFYTNLLKFKESKNLYSGKFINLNNLDFSKILLSDVIDELNSLRDMFNKVSGLNETHTLKFIIFKLNTIIKQ